MSSSRLQNEGLAIRSKESQSAASRALQIPEILSSVLLVLAWQKDETLVPCTLVNSLWNHEANRFLWELCGNLALGDMIPSVGTLAALPPERRQKYANMIRVLQIRSVMDFPEFASQYNEDQQGDVEAASQNNDGQQDDTEVASQNNDDQHDDSEENADVEDLSVEYWEGIHFPQLCELSFPRLESLEVMGPTSEEEVSNFHPHFLLPFAQPALRKLHAFEGNVDCQLISEKFLENLKLNCKGLTDVRISKDVIGDVGIERLRSFLLSLPFLETTSRDWNCIMSTAAFQAISQLPRLKNLTLTVEDEWVDNIQLSAPVLGFTGFASLTRIDLAISGHGLSAMLPYLSNIQEMNLWEFENPPRVWKAVILGEFKSLRYLSLGLRANNTMKSDDLLNMLQHTTLLHTLRIYGIENSYMEANIPPLNMEPLDDGVMDAIARRLPALKKIDLSCESNVEKLREGALISLGTHCPLLESVHIIAQIDYATLMALAPTCVWSKLVTLQVVEGYVSGGPPTEYQHRVLAKAIKLQMPLLELFHPSRVTHDLALYSALMEEFRRSREQDNNEPDIS